MSYCKLYIDTNLDIKETERIIAGATNEVYSNFKELEKESRFFYEDENSDIPCINTPIYRNENHDSSIPVGMKPCGVMAKFYVEVDDGYEDINGEEDTEIFVEIVVEIIKNLRKKLEYVVASCEFEDRIAKETGWNWTEETPFP